MHPCALPVSVPLSPQSSPVRVRIVTKRHNLFFTRYRGGLETNRLRREIVSISFVFKSYKFPFVSETLTERRPKTLLFRTKLTNSGRTSNRCRIVTKFFCLSANQLQLHCPFFPFFLCALQELFWFALSKPFQPDEQHPDTFDRLRDLIFPRKGLEP